MRPRMRRGMGDFPTNTTGAQGALIAPYDESGVWNPPSSQGAADFTGSAVVTASTAATPDPSTTGFMPASAPYGESDRPWTNPTTFATVPINAETDITHPVLSLNNRRNALVIQNNSTIGGAGDVAPTLYIGFNAQPQVGSALALSPGVGVAFDIICPRDSIYVAFGPFVNMSTKLLIQGAVIGGTYSP